MIVFIICCSEVLEAVDVLKHSKEELLNWLPTSPPLLNLYLCSTPLTNQLSIQFNGQCLFKSIGQLIDWWYQSVDQFSNRQLISRWSRVAQRSDRRPTFWSGWLSWINWLIGLISLLFKSFSFAALPTPTTSDCPRLPKLCPALITASPRCPLKSINWTISSNWTFNFLNDNLQRWPCGALFSRLLVETCNSSTTEWYTCLNNQNWSSYFLWRFIFRVRYLRKAEEDEKLGNGKKYRKRM